MIRSAAVFPWIAAFLVFWEGTTSADVLSVSAASAYDSQPGVRSNFGLTLDARFSPLPGVELGTLVSGAIDPSGAPSVASSARFGLSLAWSPAFFPPLSCSVDYLHSDFPPWASSDNRLRALVGLTSDSGFRVAAGYAYRSDRAGIDYRTDPFSLSGDAAVNNFIWAFDLPLLDLFPHRLTLSAFNSEGIVCDTLAAAHVRLDWRLRVSDIPKLSIRSRLGTSVRGVSGLVMSLGGWYAETGVALAL